MRYRRFSSGFYSNLGREAIERIIVIGYNFTLESESYDSFITRRCQGSVFEISRFHDSKIFAYAPLLDKNIIFRIMGNATSLSAKLLYRREVTVPVI